LLISGVSEIFVEHKKCIYGQVLGKFIKI
jgi:hypothetical protein